MLHPNGTIYRRLCKLAAIVAALNFSAFMFFNIIVGASAGMPENARPHDQNTYLVAVHSRYGTSTGYVRPSLGKTYDAWWSPTLWLVAGAVLLNLPYVITERRKRDREPKPPQD